MHFYEIPILCLIQIVLSFGWSENDVITLSQETKRWRLNTDSSFLIARVRTGSCREMTKMTHEVTNKSIFIPFHPLSSFSVLVSNFNAGFWRSYASESGITLCLFIYLNALNAQKKSTGGLFIAPSAKNLRSAFLRHWPPPCVTAATAPRCLGESLSYLPTRSEISALLCCRPKRTDMQRLQDATWRMTHLWSN